MLRSPAFESVIAPARPHLARHRVSVLGARVDLADALVESGPRDEARTLYQSVLARWGNAKPRSATTDHVRAALAAVGP